MRIKKEWIGMFVLVSILSILFIINLDTGEVVIEVNEEIEETIKVYISGEVISPGVYEVNSEERLDTLLKLAGGFTALANTKSVNLARHLKDGEMIVIYEASDEVVYRGIDILNYGDSEDIVLIDGIGDVLAERIINYREANGLFTSYEDLLNVEGIGEQKLVMIQASVDD
jgi:competence protein ComEA